MTGLGDDSAHAGSPSATPPADAEVRALKLVSIFHADPPAFGRFREVAGDEVPESVRRLLDHESHMTVAMERLHETPVGLRVVATMATADGDRYAREILLTGPGGRVVQHGIVTIDLAALDAASAAAIRAARIPLGRILIGSSLLCRVQSVRLLEVLPGPHLRGLFAAGGWPDVSRLYGRVAEIVLRGRTAVDLLEIAAPIDAV